MNYIEKVERLKILVSGASTDVTISEEQEKEYRGLKNELNQTAKFKKNQSKEFKFVHR
ncbi:hypothetical protein QWZ06_08235 [Chryseobacterium tructae]|uniref:hypothetical protein n=1 Tax=Chryseobacterium tructae TaxID=1037380 RepID=UPI0025B352BD|nr:hypothetical protein [Chryseobacterium tructae]MDN3692253.1 hypothetical protein [Chryseobacterium tructae]